MSNTPPRNPSPNKATKQIKAVKPEKIPDLKFVYLTEERAEQAAHLYTNSFVHLNAMWQKMGANYADVFSVNRGRMIACCKAGWTCVMLDYEANQIAAVAPSMDLIDYIDTKTMPHKSLFLQSLAKYAIELEKQFFESLRPTLKRGECLYNYGGAVNPKYANYGISKKFWSLGMIYIKTSGFKTYYGRATNRITTHLLTSFGGKVVKKVDIKEEGVTGEYMELIKIDLTHLTYDTLSKYYEEKDTNADDEL